jgi:hypothetical protein
MLCISIVMTVLGLVPRIRPVIHASHPLSGKDVDGRDEHGHDVWGFAEPIVRIVTPTSACPIDGTNFCVVGHLR